MIRNSTNVRNSVWNLANILIYPILFLAATPFFIDKLSENTFGEWMLINSYIYIVVNIVGFGLSDSVTAHVAQAIGNKNQAKLYAYINSSARLLGRMSVLAFAFGLVLVAFYFFDLYFFSTEIWKTIILATFIISLRFPEVLFQSIFKGFEHYHKAAIFNMTIKLLALFLQIFLVFKGYGLIEIFLSNLLVLLIGLTIQGVVIFGKLKGFRPRLLKALPERKEIYHFGFWTWLQTIISLAAYQTDRFIVAYFLGTATVAYYVLASTIANHLHMAFDAVVSWLLPKVSRMKENIGDTRNYFFTIRAFSIGFSLLVISLLYFVSEPLFMFWLGPDKYAKMIVFFKLFLVFESFLILSIVPKFYLNAVKSLSFNTFLELIYKSAIISGMIIFFIIYGTADSLIIGQIFALVIFMPVEYFLINKRILKENTFRETILTILPSLFTAGLLMATDWRMSIGFFVAAVVLYFLIFIKDKNFEIDLLTE